VLRLGLVARAFAESATALRLGLAGLFAKDRGAELSRFALHPSRFRDLVDVAAEGRRRFAERLDLVSRVRSPNQTGRLMLVRDMLARYFVHEAPAESRVVIQFEARNLHAHLAHEVCELPQSNVALRLHRDCAAWLGLHAATSSR
jgi:hypothetical protein